MHAGALRALEFDRIVEAVRRFAQTPLGAARLALLEPQTEPRAVATALAATSETVRFLADNQIGLHAPADLDAILSSLGVEGRALDAGHLLEPALNEDFAIDAGHAANGEFLSLQRILKFNHVEPLPSRGSSLRTGISPEPGNVVRCNSSWRAVSRARQTRMSGLGG